MRANPGAPLGSIGEEGLLDLIQPYLGGTADARLTVAPGDDAAVVAAPPGMEVAVTTDTLVEGVHFTSGDPADAVDLGWKLLAVSLSDLAAMGATPGPAFLTLALPHSWTLEHLDNLYQGLAQCAEAHCSVLAGGNLSVAPVAVLTSTCLGYVEPGKALRRSGAQPSWALAVTGRLGGASAFLHRGAAVHRPTAAVASAWRDHQQRPQPRLTAGRALVEAGIGVALDVSDGVFLDAGRLLPGAAGASGVLIDAARLPTVVGVREAWPASWLDVAGGGEDYELLFAGPSIRVEAACRRVRKAGCEAAVIGRFDRGEGVRVVVGGAERPAPRTGHLHFA